MSPITFPNMILFLAIKYFLTRSLINARVVSVFNLKILPPGQAHSASVDPLLQIHTKKKESDLYWSLEPEGVTTPHLGQPIPNLKI